MVCRFDLIVIGGCRWEHSVLREMDLKNEEGETRVVEEDRLSFLMLEMMIELELHLRHCEIK